VVDVSLVQDAQPGDYLIIHAGYAIEILDPAEAGERLKLLAEAGIRPASSESL
jgi:hydrogenase maturation factor